MTGLGDVIQGLDQLGNILGAVRGLLVPAIRTPTVPANTARLRITLSAAHSADDVALLVEALHALA